MHDIGKVGTPDHILLKPGRLTDEELEIMRRHAAIGHDILTGSARR
jgi:putative two-component system response regulator